VGGVSPVPVQMWQRCVRSRRRCGRGEPSPSADVGGVRLVPAQIVGRGEPSPGADVAGVSPVPVQMWPGGGASAEGAASLPDSGASALGRPLCRGVPAD
jgi:hypothetical protein